VEARAAEPPTGFFVHIMKTGGTSLRWMLLADVLEPDELYPHKSDGVELEVNDLLLHYINPFLLRDEIATDPRRFKMIAAHYPFLAHKLFPYPLITFSLFRDPVERVVSHLRHIQRDDHPDRSLEELYEDPHLFDSFFYNLQARAFVFEDERANSLMVRTFDWNDELLERAKENVEQLDVIGLSSEYRGFIRNLERVFDWRFSKLLHSHRSGRQQRPSRGLRRRIHDDLEYDRRFYEHVVALYRERGPVRAGVLAH
jgi:hypothetical protein